MYTLQHLVPRTWVRYTNTIELHVVRSIQYTYIVHASVRTKNFYCVPMCMVSEPVFCYLLTCMKRGGWRIRLRRTLSSTFESFTRDQAKVCSHFSLQRPVGRRRPRHQEDVDQSDHVHAQHHGQEQRAPLLHGQQLEVGAMGGTVVAALNAVALVWYGVSRAAEVGDRVGRLVGHGREVGIILLDGYVFRSGVKCLS